MQIELLPELTPETPLGAAWEDLVQGNQAAGLLQSLPWAAFKRARGLRSVHLGIFEDGALVGGMIGYVPANHPNVGLLIVPEGPVVAWGEPERARAQLRALMRAAEDLAPSHGAIGVRIEPRVLAPLPPLLRDWRRAPVDVLAPQTLCLDLTPEPEALLAAMKPKTRYNIRLAARRGVNVRVSTDPAELAPFYALLNEAGERDTFFVEPPDHFGALFDHLLPGYGRLLFAERDGQPLGALFVTLYGGRATYLYGGIGNIERGLMAGYALQWAAINTARAAGCSIYDFYGYEATGAPGHLYARFSRFKRGFGGDHLVFIGAHDAYWPDRLADAVVRAIHEIGA